MRTPLPARLAFGTAAAVFILLGGSAGCRRPPVARMAVALPLTGDLGSEGEGLLRAVTLAVDQANEARRLPYRVEVAAFDDRADPGEAENVAHLIVADPRIVAVVGHYSSDCSERAARVYAQAPLAMVSPASTNPQVTRQQLQVGWTGARVVFRLAPPDDVQGDFAARFMRQTLRRRRVTVVDDGTLYGQGLAQEFARSFRRLGGRVASQLTVKVGARDLRAVLERLKAHPPEGVFFGGRYPEAGLMLLEMRRAGLLAVFCSGDGARTPALFDVAGNAADGAYLTAAGLPLESLPSARPFIEAYQARWGTRADGPRPFDYYGYEAAQILLEGLARSGPDRGRLLAELRRTRHDGLLGLTTFDEKGDPRDRRVAMTRARASDRSFPVAR